VKAEHRLQASEYLSRNAEGTDWERWLTMAAAGAILAYGLKRRSGAGTWLALAAVPLAYKGIAGHWPGFGNGHADDTRAALSGRRGVNVREVVSLERPLDEVYQFWRRFENLPRFMRHLETVTQYGDGRSHWVACGPSGSRFEWDAEIINEVQNKVIGWRSLPNADVVSAGSVNFKSARDGRTTEVAVNLQYAPPGGKVGAFAAKLFGKAPSQTIREDLRRFKQVLEAGEIPRAVAEYRRGPVS
jgi:uncharacterized membrane protein